MVGFMQNYLNGKMFVALQRAREEYSSAVDVPTLLIKNVEWWITKIPPEKNCIKPRADGKIYQIHIELVWVFFFCRGIRPHGFFWSGRERKPHINYLELLAAFFALKCFPKGLTNCNILYRIDYNIAIACINRMGSVQFPILNGLPREIWQWCEEENLFIFASSLVLWKIRKLTKIHVS